VTSTQALVPHNQRFLSQNPKPNSKPKTPL
jgi:hypothetical protein